MQQQQQQKPVDVVIVGGGLVGLMMAKEITARTPLSVLVLERGQPRNLANYSTDMDEVDYALRFRMMQNLSEETSTHRHSSKDTAVPIRQYGSFNPGTGVGGAAEHWGAVSYRFYPEHFTLGAFLRETFKKERLPENLAAQNWGFTYDQIEPYYWRAEQLMGVCGKAGNLGGKKVDGGNVFEGPRAHEYPNPYHKLPYASMLFDKAARELGYHPYPIPTATLSRTYTNPDGITRTGCAYCGYCTRFGCMVGAKAQPTNMLMPVLANRKNFALRTGCSVRRVVHKDGHATGVNYIDETGAQSFQPAGIVIVAGWTLNSVKLLFLSKVGTPYDPATGKGTLGKNLTHQVSQATRIFFDKPLNAFMGAGGLGIAVSDFDGKEGLEKYPGVIRGGNVRVASGGDMPISSFGAIPPATVERNWGAEWKKAGIEFHDHTSTVSSEAEHLSYRQNYLDLDPQYKDKYGDPLIRLTLDWTPHERAQGAMLADVHKQVAKAMGARLGESESRRLERYTTVQYQSTHVNGGVIMGESPDASVVNSYLQHWQVPNLFVAGGSAFPQNGSGNPTMTIMAIALRSADALIDRYVKKPGSLA